MTARLAVAESQCEVLAEQLAVTMDRAEAAKAEIRTLRKMSTAAPDPCKCPHFGGYHETTCPAAPLGTRYVAALVEVSGDETPVPKEEQASRSKATKAKPAHDKKRWSELPLSQQAAMRCNEPGFSQFLTAKGWLLNSSSAQAVRDLCEVETRADIKEGTEAGKLWRKIDTEYQLWLREPEYA